MSMIVTFKVSWWEEVCPLWAPIPIRPLIVRALILSYPLGTLSALAQDCSFLAHFLWGGGGIQGWWAGGRRGLLEPSRPCCIMYIFFKV